MICFPVPFMCDKPGRRLPGLYEQAFAGIFTSIEGWCASGRYEFDCGTDDAFAGGRDAETGQRKSGTPSSLQFEL